jgi:two-component system chemotaxis response regulator CheY
MIKVTIADDEAAVLSSTAAILRVFGFTVVTVADSKAILTTLRSEPPDVLLQDVRMPGLDLVAHLKAIRADPCLESLPVVLFTANVDAEDLWHDAGATDVIEKPFDPYRLKELIEKYGRRHEAPESR